MKDMPGSLGVSMSYFSGGRFKMNVTTHTNGNVIYNFIEEYQKVTMLDNYTQDSQSVNEFKQTLSRWTTLCMPVSDRLAKQSSNNCYLTIQ
jgi:hypothetical protein